MKRYSAAYLSRNPHMKGRDFETTRKACEKFRDTPTSVINFVEGTRFTEDKRIRHKDPYRHVLRPRAGGFAVAMTAMGDMLDAVLDITIVYPDGAATFWDLCCGQYVEAIVHVRQLEVEEWLTVGDYENDRDWRRRALLPADRYGPLSVRGKVRLRCRYRRDDDGAETGDFKFAENNFKRKYGSGDGGIEGGRNTGGSTATDHGSHSIAGYVK